MRFTVQRNVDRPIELANVTPELLKTRVRELEGLVDDVTNALRKMGAEESTIQVTLHMGYRYGYVQGTGERKDEE